MLMNTFVLLNILLVSVILGSYAENAATKTTTIPSWIFQISGRDVFIPTGEQNDKRNYRLSLSGKSSDQMNAESVGTFPLVELGGRYYYFQTYFKANYHKAFEFCREHGMELLSIESKDENYQIINYLQENITYVDNLWTSGTDLAQEGTFVWLSTGRKFGFTNWVPPNPDNSGTVEHCLHFWKLGPKNIVWNDTACKNEYYFACESTQH